MRTKLLILMTIIASLVGCKSKEPTGKADGAATPAAVPAAMPQGRLNYVEHSYHAMYMAPFSNFELKRIDDSDSCEFKFYHYDQEETHTVSDTLLDAARRIISEEKMYEYAKAYINPMADQILDGYNWSFLAIFDGKEHISSHGRQASAPGNGIRLLGEMLSNAAEQVADKIE